MFHIRNKGLLFQSKQPRSPRKKFDISKSRSLFINTLDPFEFNMEERTQKAHIKKKAGKKVERKKENKFSNAKKSSNPKAYTFQSAGRAEKNVRRNNDLGEKKLHVPLVDRTPIESPPVVIAVVGPPGVSYRMIL